MYRFVSRVGNEERARPDQRFPAVPYTAGMQPDAASPLPSPFSAIPEAEWVCANELAFAIFDSFPVSPGHVLVITRYAGDMPDPRGGVRFV